MSDVVVYTEGGRTYRVTGLEAKASSIGTAVFEADQAIGDLLDAAEAALVDWRGRHAATFAEDVNELLGRVVSLRISLWEAKSLVAAFPERAAGGSFVYDAGLRYARVEVPDERGTASAVPDQLRTYADVATGLYERFPTLAATVNLEGVTAEVSTERCLDQAERQDRLDAGVDPMIVAEETVTETEPVTDVGTLVPLVSPEPELAPLQAACMATAELATAGAIAFETSDRRLLDLLGDYPELAGFVVDGMEQGRVGGEASLAIVLAYFSVFDTADQGGDPDGRVSRGDLEAIRDRSELPAYVRDAARYLLDNPVLFGLAETVHESDDPLGENGDDRLSADDIETFLAFNASLRVVEQRFDAFDTAAHGGSGDGRVSRGDLEAVAAGTGPMAEAARWLLDHDTQREPAGHRLLRRARRPSRRPVRRRPRRPSAHGGPPGSQLGPVRTLGLERRARRDHR